MVAVPSFFSVSSIPYVLGVTAFLIFAAFVMNLLKNWRKPIDVVNSPMSITLRTEKTPAELNSAARTARNSRRLFWLGVLLVGYALLHVFNASLASALDAFFVELLTFVSEGLSQFFAYLAGALGSAA